MKCNKACVARKKIQAPFFAQQASSFLSLVDEAELGVGRGLAASTDSASDCDVFSLQRRKEVLTLRAKLATHAGSSWPPI